MVNIPGYTHVCKYRSDRKGSGVSILLKNGIPYKRREDLDTFIEGKTESVFIETISKGRKPVIIGSIYRPLNTDLDQFSDNLTNIVNKAQTTKRKIPCEIILGMDHNVDLLKGNQHLPTHNFIEILTNLSLYPTITRPSRITHHSVTLIDNIYISDQLHRSFDSMLLINDISDHLPTLALLKQTKLLKQEPLIYESRCLNDAKLKEANHRLMRKDWIGLLVGTSCDEKFDQFNNTLNEVLDEIAPMKKVCISAKRRYIEPWMTKGLERAGKTKLKLYRKCLESTSTGADRNEYTEYRNIFNNLKRNLKVQYYQQKCNQYKDNVKKLWALINETIRKVKHKGSIIPYIRIDGKLNYTPKDIVNGFRKFYSSLGSTLVQQIVPGMTSVKDYINQIPRQRDSMVIRKTTPVELDAIIKKLPNKASHGHDEVSNIMLKALRTSIVFPLCHIFNHSILEGKFPTCMKLAEVIPLYKGKNMDQMVNYRPISLLITLSKLLEKIIYQRIYDYLEDKSILYPSQYGFRKRDPVNR